MLTVTEPNYAAQIVRVSQLLTLAGADRLDGIPLFGMQALTSKGGVKVGDLGVLFPTECQLSEDFCKKNNLYSSQLLNENTWAKGYLSDNRSVRAIKLRGHNSNCLFMTLRSLENIGIDVSALKEGDVFNSIGGVEICRKYKIVQQQSSNPKNKTRNQQRKCRIEEKLLPMHIDTDNWWRNEHKISDETEVIVTAKYHGCVHESTMIDTLEYGSKTIGEIVNNKINCRIKARDIVSNEDIFVPIDQYYRIDNDGDWYELEMEDGTKLIITGNNPVWLPEHGCYRRVDELIEGDTCLTE